MTTYKEEWKRLMSDDYIRAERKAADEKYWKERIEYELRRRKVRDSGSWWQKFVWDYFN